MCASMLFCLRCWHELRSFDDNTKYSVADYRDQLYRVVLEKEAAQRRAHRSNSMIDAVAPSLRHFFPFQLQFALRDSPP